MITQFFISVLVFLGLDFFWLRFVAGIYYKKDSFEATMKSGLNIDAHHLSLLGVYIALSFLTTFFVIPAFRTLGISWQTFAIAFGFGVGLFAFYELANLTFMSTSGLVIPHIIWGGILISVGTVISLYIKDYIFR